MNHPQPAPPEFAIRYDKSDIAYITQFLVSPGNEEVLLELSSGLLNDADQSADRKQTLPIQTRIALPWSAAERLAKILNKVVATKRQQVERQRNSKQPRSSQVVIPEASLPQMTSEPV